MKPTKILGLKKEEVHYTARPGVYALPVRKTSEGHMEVGIVYIQNERFPEGKHVLLGGAIDAEDGGDHHVALMREIREEVGREAYVGAFLERVDEYYYSSSLQQHLKKEGYFYKVQLGDEICKPVEVDHQLVWYTPQEAIEKLHHLCARYIIEKLFLTIQTL